MSCPPSCQSRSLSEVLPAGRDSPLSRRRGQVHPLHPHGRDAVCEGWGCGGGGWGTGEWRWKRGHRILWRRQWQRWVVFLLLYRLYTMAGFISLEQGGGGICPSCKLVGAHISDVAPPIHYPRPPITNVYNQFLLYAALECYFPGAWIESLSTLFFFLFLVDKGGIVGTC